MSQTILCIHLTAGHIKHQLLSNIEKSKTSARTSYGLKLLTKIIRINTLCMLQQKHTKHNKNVYKTKYDFIHLPLQQ